MKTKKRKVILIIALVIIALAIIQTLPIIMLKPLGSLTMSNDYINLYYHKLTEQGAKEVFDLLVEKTQEIYTLMDYERTDPIKVYIYKTQNQLAIREAGFITLTFAPSWHIGDSHWGNIMMVSPYTKVPGHTHDSILTATLHELVHSINYRINKDISYFWDNGLATYLANQIPEENEYKNRSIPSISDMHTDNGLRFGNMGGYAFSYLYIEFLETTYGWDKVVAFASGKGDYEQIFNKAEQDIYVEWSEYVNQK